MDLTKITRKEWKHTMSQLRAGEGVRWTFWFNTEASTHIYLVLENSSCDGCWWTEGWILLSNGYWAAVWLKMTFRHYWLAGDWSWPCRSRRFSLGCQSPQLSSSLEFIWCLFFPLVVCIFFPPLVRSSVAKYISKQKNSTIPRCSKKWWCLSFWFFSAAKIWPFLIKRSLLAPSLVQANTL